MNDELALRILGELLNRTPMTASEMAGVQLVLDYLAARLNTLREMTDEETGGDLGADSARDG